MKKYLFAALGFGFFAVSAFGIPDGLIVPGRLKITVDRFDNSRGSALVALYRKGDKLYSLDTAFRTGRSGIENGRAVVAFENLPHGRYAAIAAHDENDNGKVDHHWYGPPAEQVGLSNGAEFSISTGRPGFEEMAFEYSSAVTAQIIHLKK